MADITRITTPLMPQENVGGKYKPASDQSIGINDPSKVQKPQAEGQIQDQQNPQAGLQTGVSKEMMEPLLRSATSLMQTFQKMTVLLQMGISTSELMENAEMKELMASVYLSPDQLARALKEQDASALLFKGAAFDVLRDVMSKFEDNPKIKEAVAQLLKTFEYNVNTENSVKTILNTCQNLLDYMFSRDKAQFSEYLKGLAEMLLPPEGEGNEQAAEARPQPEAPGQPQQQGQAQQAQGQTPQTQGQPQAQQPQPLPGGVNAQQQNPAQQPPPAQPGQPTGTIPLPGQEQAEPTAQPAQAGQPQPQTQAATPEPLILGKALGMEQQEAAQILKGNLLPLLGEIVVKYNQNEKIRDMVMVVVHNIVRVDQGTDEDLQLAVKDLAKELQLVANLPDKFEKHLADSVMRSAELVKSAQNETITKMTEIVSRTLSSPGANAATVRQAENLLMSMLQNQNSLMNILHFVLPMETARGKQMAEMYVDPDSEERVGRGKEHSRKIFLAVESESLGAFELSFLQTGSRVDFAMWCPQILVKSLSAIKRSVADIMQAHGYTMNTYKVDELVERQSVSQVFPKLLNRRTGVDVRI